MALARFAQFAALCGGFGEGALSVTIAHGMQGVSELLGVEIEDVVALSEGAGCDKTVAQFEGHGPQDRPGIAKVEGDFFADEVVFHCQPPAEAELPVF